MNVFIEAFVKFRRELREILAQHGIPSNPGWTEDDIIRAIRSLLEKPNVQMTMHLSQPMQRVQMESRANITLTAEDWQFPTAMKGTEVAASEINQTIEKHFNKGDDRATTEAAAVKVMRKHANVGASNTEPFDMLQAVLNALYGLEGYSGGRVDQW